MPSLNSWFPIPKSSHFSLANIPFGIVSTSTRSTPHPAVAIGEHVLDLQDFTANNGFSELPDLELSVFSQTSLNEFAALGRNMHARVRRYIQDIFDEATKYPEALKDNVPLQHSCLLRQSDVKMHLPMTIRDYTDFYVGKNHAFNVGCLFRGPENALQPNYTHLPVGYHGRASSIVVSGTPIVRPNGQILENPTEPVKKPIFSPCRRLDYELELGAFVCKSNPMGQPIALSEAADHIFGLVLLNDWSARDVQMWEYIPLGPFNAKNFGSSISPWVVLTDALEPFATKGIENHTELLPYLREGREDNVYDIRLEVEITPHESKNATTISRSNGKHLLFSFPQMIAHHTVGGCNMNVGDLLGSGTISGPDSGAEGSILELNKGGKEAIKLQDGVQRRFLEDGDEVVFRGVAGNVESGLVGFGEVRGRILPAPKLKLINEYSSYSR